MREGWLDQRWVSWDRLGLGGLWERKSPPDDDAGSAMDGPAH